MAAMNADGTWNVTCYGCGKQLGSNKSLCKAGSGPCVWAHTDASIVARCMSKSKKSQAAQPPKGNKAAPQVEKAVLKVSTRVYASDVACTGIIQKLETNTDGTLLRRYVIAYDDVEEGQDPSGPHETRDVFLLLDSVESWPKAAMPYMCDVTGQGGFCAVSQVARVTGFLVHACVDTKGQVHYYGIQQLNTGKVFYCHCDAVTKIVSKQQRQDDAAAAKEQQEKEGTEQARERLKGGWLPSYEEPEHPADGANLQDMCMMYAGAGAKAATPTAELKAPTLADLQKKAAQVKVMETTALQAAQSHSEPTDGKSVAVIANADDGNTVWTHQSKMMFYGWVTRLNPFRAARGQTEEAWTKVAESVAESTKHLTRKEGKIQLSGNALRVYLTKQLGDEKHFGSYKKKLRDEATTSGHTGKLSDHETKEYTELERIDAMKKESQEEGASLKADKDMLKQIKDTQMNDEIYKAAMAKPEFKAMLFKTLSKKRKALEIKIEGLVAASKKPRTEVVANDLDEEERKMLQRHEDLKAEKRARNESTTDGYDSDDNANRGQQKKGRFQQTMAAITNLEAMSQQQRPETALEKTLMRWLEAKMAQPNSVPDADTDLQKRLQRLDAALEAKVISKEEHKQQRARILASAF